MFVFSVVCASIDTPQSGLVSVSTNGTTSMATYSCAEGYTGVGDTVRTCGEDGQWHGSEIVCCKYLDFFLLRQRILSVEHVMHIQAHV